MPHIQQLFSDIADIVSLPGRAINSDDLRDADALLCRSITLVNQDLLKETGVKFVGTATIGTDHLDIEWLNDNQIAWSNAPGCNAAAVAQYVISAVCYWLKNDKKKNLADICVGIVGAGNVGSELARCLEILSVRYLLCDPPLQRQGDPREFVDFSQILHCDVITLHVPITYHGVDSTFHLVDQSILNQLSEQQLLINAARGDIVDNQALNDYFINTEKLAQVSIVLDVFENEPAINYSLAQQCLLATPHIAGHTLEGKSRGSYMVYQAFCEFFNLTATIKQAQLFPAENLVNTQKFDNDVFDEGDFLLDIYDIENDTKRLMSVEAPQIAEHFDQLRKNYVSSESGRPRRDYSGWRSEGELNKPLTRLLQTNN